MARRLASIPEERLTDLGPGLASCQPDIAQLIIRQVPQHPAAFAFLHPQQEGCPEPMRGTRPWLRRPRVPHRGESLLGFSWVDCINCTHFTARLMVTLDYWQRTGLYPRCRQHRERDHPWRSAARHKAAAATHLAYDIGVTIGTVSRAYALVHERGLVAGEVGRGTYVLERSNGKQIEQVDPITQALAGTRGLNTPDARIRFDTTAAPDIGQGEIIGKLFADISSEHQSEISSYSRNFPTSWFEAGQIWLARHGWKPDIETVVPTLGAHAGAIAVISAVTSPGDKIVFENLTYTQISRATRLLGRRSILVDSDEHGMIPDDFERLCQQQHPRLAFLMPTAHNPTLVTMPESRRRAIAAIARRHSVWLIEDDLYGGMTGDQNPLMAAIAPERTFVVSSLAKSVTAGVRGGWVACPPHFAQRIKVTHKMTTGGLPFILAETCARLVLGGTHWIFAANRSRKSGRVSKLHRRRSQDSSSTPTRICRSCG
ncbi:aminotransferase class I and II domain-containing protein [Ditylenchus destructor]|uniref:Aminotransferase class I and II domain-containing protein n=1 Tax=Ditylenchus destructor TaxID=166010 RepID=A0AAD4MDW0_9BILA|nr:aminotransferase class I and II domain-containing protein [Ditylenchus destructor]